MVVDLQDMSDITAFLRRVREIPLLTLEEETDLARRIKQGDKEAKDKLIISNLRLVISIAKRYSRKGPDFMELIQEGVFGLIRAAEKFDLQRECKFGTYSTYWISVFIAKYINKNTGLLYIPAHAIQKLNQYCKVYNENTFVDLNDDESDELVRDILLEEMGEAEYEKSEELYRLTQQYFSLHEHMKGGDFTFEDVILEESQEFTYEDVIMLNCDINEAIKECLDSEETKIITLKYGLNGEASLTINEISDDLVKPKERVRKVEKVALDKLKKQFNKSNYVR
jgi:RNA polymerase primary sigma factor